MRPRVPGGETPGSSVRPWASKRETAVSSATAAMSSSSLQSTSGLPPEGSLYYDALKAIPIGESVSMELQPDADELDEDDQALISFCTKKVAEDKWVGVPNKIGQVGTDTLFEHILEQMEDEEFIRVCHGADPILVKKERGERGE